MLWGRRVDSASSGKSLLNTIWNFQLNKTNGDEEISRQTKVFYDYREEIQHTSLISHLCDICWELERIWILESTHVWLTDTK